MPPTSDSRRSRSTRENARSRSTREDVRSRSKLQTNESATESGSATEEEEVSAMQRFFTPKVVGLVVGALCLAMLILIGIFIGIAVFLSTSVDFNDLTCENIFGPSEDRLKERDNKSAKKPEIRGPGYALPEPDSAPFALPTFLHAQPPKLEPSGEGVGVDQYLPKVIYPYHYDVNLRINMPVNGKGEFQVGGFVHIHFNVTQNTKRVFFNVHNIDVAKAAYMHKQTLTVRKGDHPDVRYVDTPELLEVGKKYVISFQFTSRFDSGMNGLYYSKYLDTKGQVHYTASTQFEAQSARRVFPCLDEPYYRSSFKFVIEHPSSYDAYSNMPNVSRTVLDDGNFARTEFQPIPNAPTYILALLLADDYAYISEKAASGTEVRVLTRKEFINDAQESLKYAVKGLNWFNEFFRIPYPHPKLDVAGIVAFEAGAMENLGLTTYRETILLSNEHYVDKSGLVEGQKTILHEFAHQWFGNLVTPVDWSQTFMSEGFARFFETYALLAISGDASKYSIEVALDSWYLMIVDSLNVHPNDYVFRSGQELHDGFDMMTYDRASSVFNMIRGFVGDEIFFAALRNYLAANSNGHSHWQKLAVEVQNAATHDPQLSKVDFTAFFEAWFTVPGYPVVNVKKNGRVFTLTASYFSLVSSPIKDSRWGPGEKWPIPIWYRVSSNPSELKRTMMEPGKKLTINVHNDNDVIFVNSEAHGYYLVNYEGALFNQVITGLAGLDSPDYLGAKVRFQTDMCPLFLAGHIEPRVFFETLLTLSRAKVLETQLSSCLGLFSYIANTKDTEIKGAYKDFIYEVFFPTGEMHDRISQAGLNYYLDAARRYKEYQMISKLSCEINAALCAEEEQRNFYQKVFKTCGPSFVVNQTTSCVQTGIDGRAITYCEGIKSGKPEWYELLVKLFINSRNPFEQSRLMTGLACTPDDYAVSKLFTLITTPNDVINKNGIQYFSILSGEHRVLIRRLFIENMEQILSDFPTAAETLLSTALKSNSEKDYLELIQLIKDNPHLVKRFAHIFRNILNESRAYIETTMKNLPGTVEFFKERYSSKLVKKAKDPKLCAVFGSCIED